MSSRAVAVDNEEGGCLVVGLLSGEELVDEDRYELVDKGNFDLRTSSAKFLFAVGIGEGDR